MRILLKRLPDKKSLSLVATDICSLSLISLDFSKYFKVSPKFCLRISISFQSFHCSNFLFHSKKNVDDLHEYFILYSHKRIYSCLFMYNFACLIYDTMIHLPIFNIKVSQFYWSVFPHVRVFIKELSTNITSYHHVITTITVRLAFFSLLQFFTMIAS